MSNDNAATSDEWTIEVPESQRAFLQKLANDVQRLSEQSRAIERHLRTTPSRNDILPFLDEKVNIDEVKRLSARLATRLDGLRDRQTKQSSNFSGQLLLQQQQLVSLQASAGVVTKFQAEYSELLNELQRLRSAALETEARAQQNLADYKQEQTFITTTFEKLSTISLQTQDQLQTLNQQQKYVEEKLQTDVQELNKSYTQVVKLGSDVSEQLKDLSKRLPAEIENAREVLKADVQAAVNAEQQKRAAEQAHANRVVTTLQDRLERLEIKMKEDAKNASLGIRTLEEKVFRKLSEIQTETGNMLDQQQTELNALTGRLQQLVKEQQTQVSKLATFEASFGAADRQWKAAVQQVQEYTHGYVGRLEAEIKEAREKVEAMLQSAATAAESAKQLSEDIKSSWETDWKTREARVDEQLIQLKKLADEVVRGVEAETVSRDQAIRDLETRVQNVCAGLRAQCELKADRNDVVKALWLKVDK